MTVGPTSICTSAGIFQKYFPSKRAWTPSDMYCRYSFQFSIVMVFPTGSAEAAPGISEWCAYSPEVEKLVCADATSGAAKPTEIKQLRIKSIELRMFPP